jgi:hypothetical protein
VQNKSELSFDAEDSIHQFKSVAISNLRGHAMDVPEIVFVAVLLVFHALLMILPGAKMSTHSPKFEKPCSVLIFKKTMSIEKVVRVARVAK